MDFLKNLTKGFGQEKMLAMGLSQLDKLFDSGLKSIYLVRVSPDEIKKIESEKNDQVIVAGNCKVIMSNDETVLMTKKDFDHMQTTIAWYKNQYYQKTSKE